MQTWNINFKTIYWFNRETDAIVHRQYNFLSLPQTRALSRDWQTFSSTRYSIQLISRLPRRDLLDHLARQRYTHLTRDWRAARWKWARRWCFLGVTTLWIIGSNRHSRADCRYQQDCRREPFFPSFFLIGEGWYVSSYIHAVCSISIVYTRCPITLRAR